MATTVMQRQQYRQHQWGRRLGGLVTTSSAAARSAAPTAPALTTVLAATGTAEPFSVGSSSGASRGDSGVTNDVSGSGWNNDNNNGAEPLQLERQQQ